MSYTFTKTHTNYFDDDHLRDLKRVCLAMAADLDDRAPAIDKELLDKARARLNALTMVIELCSEEAD